jgi:hypothetical protein
VVILAHLDDRLCNRADETHAEGIVRSDGVVDDAERRGEGGEVDAVADLVAVEPLVVERLEEPLDLAIGSRGLLAGTDVAQVAKVAKLAHRGHPGGEAGALEAGLVVDDDRECAHVAGVRVRQVLDPVLSPRYFASVDMSRLRSL